ncbi:class I SAM-dependent methyltransferase [Patescibacteria group bacterium]|nr:class I SAM-dependent methyltransferase [Patescibacteria group bacterium]
MKQKRKTIPLNSSFRDPSGYVFKIDDKIYRRVNLSYKDQYDHLISLNLYQDLVEKNLLIPHKEVTLKQYTDENTYKILEPDTIPFITYPYEWCFSHLKDAALTLLNIQTIALTHGMTLKDASSYNMQIHEGNHLLIDSLSFEIYEKGSPWIAYRQFCQHFLAPLALAAYKDPSLIQLLKIHLDGIPLDLASKLLPNRSYLNTGLGIHLHLHSFSQKRNKNRHTRLPKGNVSKNSMYGLIESLKSTVHSLKLNGNQKTTWENYYNETNYTDTSFEEKVQFVSQWAEQLKPSIVWDIGANTGIFSRNVAKYCKRVISIDNDLMSIEQNYSICRENHIKNCTPLVIDITNPSPNIGWNLQERVSLLNRKKPDLVLALALIHHLVIGNNTPLDMLASFFNGLTDNLIVEFIPKSDSQVQKLLSTRDDIFDTYDKNQFEKTFSKYYIISACQQLKKSKRILYHMSKKMS